MKPRKLIVTIEMLTDIPSGEFGKSNIQVAFDDGFVNANAEPRETLEVHQVRTQVVKENK